MKKLLSEKQLHIDALESRIRTLSLEAEESLYVSGAEGGQVLRVESCGIEVDQDVMDEESRADDKPHLSFCEPENGISEIEVAELAYNVEED